MWDFLAELRGNLGDKEKEIHASSLSLQFPFINS